MTLVDPDDIVADLRCPKCRNPLRGGAAQLSCASCRAAYAAVHAGGRTWPVLVDETDTVLDLAVVFESGASTPGEKRLGDRAARMLTRFTHPYNHVAEHFLTRMVRDTKSRSSSPRILVIGGGSVGNGLDAFYDDPGVRLYAFDIYASPAVQLVADAHSLPWPDAYFDGVVVQAILEHVLFPDRVVAEISRVLVDGGYVYADTPFMQQVHEGAYDFTRFTDSGHRWLFRQFDRVSSGAVSTAGTALLWSIAYFVRAVSGSRKLGTAVRMLCSWLMLFDRIIPAERAVDGASSCYFYGRKSSTALTPQELIAYYSAQTGRPNG